MKVIPSNETLQVKWVTYTSALKAKVYVAQSIMLMS